MKNITKTGITSLAAITLVAGLAGPAMAAESSSASHDVKPRVTLSSLQARASTGTAKRLVHLNEALTKVQANTHLSEASKAAMVDTLNATISTLTSDEAKIAADTDLATAKADVKQLRKDAASGVKEFKAEQFTASSEAKSAEATFFVEVKVAVTAEPTETKPVEAKAAEAAAHDAEKVADSTTKDESKDQRATTHDSTKAQHVANPKESKPAENATEPEDVNKPAETGSEDPAKSTETGDGARKSDHITPSPAPTPETND